MGSVGYIYKGEMEIRRTDSSYNSTPRNLEQTSVCIKI